MKSKLKFGLVLLAAALAGCYQYVNIPAEDGDVAMHTVNAGHVVDAEYEALRAVADDTAIKGAYRIVLPWNTYPTTYDRLCARLGPSVIWSKAQTQPAIPTLEVKHVYIRGTVATVDVIRPADINDLAGPRQLVSVDLNLYPIGGWGVAHLHAWHISLDNALIKTQGVPRESP